MNSSPGGAGLPTEILTKRFGSRIRILPGKDSPKAEYILLWVDQAVRVTNNHALAAAIEIANSTGLPLYAWYALDSDAPGATSRQLAFRLQGLADLEQSLAELGIPLITELTAPPTGITAAASKAACVVGDIGYTRIQRQWRDTIARSLQIPFILLESDIVVPASQASNKAEYSAATLRRKLNRLIDLYLAPVQPPLLQRRSSRLEPLPFKPLHLLEPAAGLSEIRGHGFDSSVSPVEWISGGETGAHVRLEQFINEELIHYARARNDPGLNIQSGLSPYLHFGQISPITAAVRVMAASIEDPRLSEGAAGFLEQLIIRRELAINFVLHTHDYDLPSAIPDWALRTLQDHAADPRAVSYSHDQLLAAETDDPYWNAAQSELTTTGKMHGYMRMYWGKKLLEWLPDWQEAYELLVQLNDTWSLDGQDPNGYAGVAWVFGRHDRPFPERPCFGKLRPMGEKGLKRKFEMDLYLHRAGTIS